MVKVLQEVLITTSHNGLLVTIPDGIDWSTAAADLDSKLSNPAEPLSAGGIQIDLGRRALNAAQLEALRDALIETHHLDIRGIVALNDGTRQAADSLEIWAATSLPPATGNIELEPEKPKVAPEHSPNNALYLRQTFRSGQSLRHNGTVIISGDVNSGAEITADGDIVVFGTLRGMAHAGASGNADSQIMALNLRPTQIRIANFIARRPDHTALAPSKYPEVARVLQSEIHVIPLREMH